MGNLDLYNQGREVPEEAKKPYKANGVNLTNISPMWRIKKLTEMFGAAGIGWWTEDVSFEVKEVQTGEILVFCSLNLRIKLSEEQISSPIFGIGGNKMMLKRQSGLVSSDDAYKMAYTDALGIAAKALGIGADVWFQNDAKLYEEQKKELDSQSQSLYPPAALDPLEALQKNNPEEPVICDSCWVEINGTVGRNGEYINALSVKEKLNGVCITCWREKKKSEEQ